MARYVIDSDQSQVWIDASSTLHPIHSTTTGVEGWVELEFEDGRVATDGEQRGRLELPVSRLSSGNPLEDREMRRRVDVKRYPSISGELSTLEPLDDEARYRVRGALTFHGVTRSVEDEMTIVAGDDDTVVLEGASVFDVREFDFEPPRILMLRVHAEVSVRVKLVARRESGGDE